MPAANGHGASPDFPDRARDAPVVCGTAAALTRPVAGRNPTEPRGTIMFDHETSAELAQNLAHDDFDGAWTADDWAEACASSIDLPAYGSDEE